MWCRPNTVLEVVSDPYLAGLGPLVHGWQEALKRGIRRTTGSMGHTGVAGGRQNPNGRLGKTSGRGEASQKEGGASDPWVTRNCGSESFRGALNCVPSSRDRRCPPSGRTQIYPFWCLRQQLIGWRYIFRFVIIKYVLKHYKRNFMENWPLHTTVFFVFPVYGFYLSSGLIDCTTVNIHLMTL